MQVTDRVCVVTGGGSGIGKALCERFAADGARKVIVVDRAADNATAVADAIGGDAEVVDVGDETEITEMLLRVEDTYGPIDVLCNNAGIASGGNPLDTPTPAQLAIAWLLHQGDDILPIPGTGNPAHAVENARADQVTLSAELLARLDALVNQGTVMGGRYNAQAEREVDTETFSAT